eukprot:gb/GECG01009818.1/.p1 GENE.gb/GECG01009818.1/~~gb/GECG01009818.1/.p1  ORF type:complete len:1065 (+),score=141.72 gb/GECG01009818.1/:1-3195(+)
MADALIMEQEQVQNKRQKVASGASEGASRQSLSSSQSQSQPKVKRTKPLSRQYRAHQLTNGKWYFENTTTGQTSWDAPSPVVYNKQGEPEWRHEIFPSGGEDEKYIRRTIKKRYAEALVKLPRDAGSAFVRENDTKDLFEELPPHTTNTATKGDKSREGTPREITPSGSSLDQKTPTQSSEGAQEDNSTEALWEKLANEDSIMEVDGIRTINRLVKSATTAEERKSVLKLSNEQYTGYAEIGNFVAVFLACSFGEEPERLKNTKELVSMPVESPTVNNLAVKTLESRLESQLGEREENKLQEHTAAHGRSWFKDTLFRHRPWRRLMLNIAVRSHTSKERNRAGEKGRTLALIEHLMPREIARNGHHLEVTTALHVIEKCRLFVHRRIHRDLTLLCLTSSRALLDRPEDGIFTLDSPCFLPGIVKYSVDRISSTSFSLLLFMFLLGRLEKSCSEWDLDDSTHKNRVRSLSGICKSRLRRLHQEAAFAGLRNQIYFEKPLFKASFPGDGKIEAASLQTSLSARAASVAYDAGKASFTNPISVLSELCLDLWRSQQKYLSGNTLGASVKPSALEEGTQENFEPAHVRDMLLGACSSVLDSVVEENETNTVLMGLKLNISWVRDIFGSICYSDQVAERREMAGASQPGGISSFKPASVDFDVLSEGFLTAVLEYLKTNDMSDFRPVLSQPWIIWTLLKRMFTDLDVVVASPESSKTDLPEANSAMAPPVLRLCAQLLSKLSGRESDEDNLLLLASICRNGGMPGRLRKIRNKLNWPGWVFRSESFGEEESEGADLNLIDSRVLLALRYCPLGVCGVLLWMVQQITGPSAIRNQGVIMGTMKVKLDMAQLLVRIHPQLSPLCWLVPSAVLCLRSYIPTFTMKETQQLETYAVNAFVPVATEGKSFSLCAFSLAKWITSTSGHMSPAVDQSWLRRFLEDVKSCLQQPYSPHFLYSVFKSVRDVLEGLSLDRHKPEDLDLATLLQNGYTPGYQTLRVLGKNVAEWVLTLCRDLLTSFESLKTVQKDAVLSQFTSLRNSKLLGYPGGLPSSVTVPCDLRTLCEETARVVVRK